MQFAVEKNNTINTKYFDLFDQLLAIESCYRLVIILIILIANIQKKKLNQNSE